MKRQYRRPKAEIIRPDLSSLLAGSDPSQKVIPFSNETDADPEEDIL